MSDTTSDPKQQSYNPQAMAAYPNRYYAQYDPKAAEPSPIVGWYDMWAYSSLDGLSTVRLTYHALPSIEDLLPLTVDYWTQHITDNQTPRAVQDGKIVAYNPPAPVIALKTQASYVLQQARTTVYNNYGILNEATPDAWVTYLKALMAIANGEDTKSTALPTAPAA